MWTVCVRKGEIIRKEEIKTKLQTTLSFACNCHVYVYQLHLRGRGPNQAYLQAHLLQTQQAWIEVQELV